jgi:hypothetical protein
MAPLSLAELAGQIERDALDAWGELAGLMAAELSEKSLGKMHQPFVEHQKELHAQLRSPALASMETELDKIGQVVAGVIERINVLRTALIPVWARKKKAAGGSLSALPIGTIEKLERRRTELMDALGKLADAAKQLGRALENPPATSADPADGGDDNREVG